MVQQETTAGNARIIALHPAVQQPEYLLSEQVCTIGRSSSCQIVIAGLTNISRGHARIERSGSHYILIDEESANGTFVNHERIEAPYMLQHHDTIGLGTADVPILRFEVLPFDQASQAR